ncbi:DMT family transporter [Pelagicoccus albus]|uniref:DMT family transporter n=1 Tax=Pelagicoccus albus TaxID=415222 RepID=A0A7X1B3M5_9BACT|nr:DMT family transporter [Pelagicoccus albus]MBC2604992.1 DMT family transporter [Pelagicoccus albus]
MEPYHSIPIATGLIYTVATLCIKRATTNGVGPWRTTFVSNFVIFLVAFPFWFFGEPIEDFKTLFMPLVIGTGFFFGQVLTCLGIHKGDVSLLTPLLGMKTIMVAFMVSIGLGEDLRAEVWIGAVLSAVAVLLMSGSSKVERKRALMTIAFGLGTSFSFAACDTAMQAYGSTLGFHKITAGTFTVVMAYSFLLIPFFSGSVRGISGRTWTWLLAGTSLLALQAAMMSYVFSVFGKAAVVNVIYSARGIWSVILVWAIGHWFSNDERNLGRAVLGRRLIGATLLATAIVVVMR